jgi:hypothetical protein
MTNARLKPPIDGDRTQAREKLKICEICGEIFDLADPAQRAHHARPEHEPLLLPRHHKV